MRLYEIMIDFRGAQDGITVEEFRAGTRRELSDWLAAGAPPGAIRPAAQIENKAIVTDGGQTGRLKRK